VPFILPPLGQAGDPAVHARCRRPGGFTLVEALVSTSIIAIAGTSVLLGIAASIQATDDALTHSIALGMARQLIDEVSGQRYMEAGASPYDTRLEPEADESAGPGRSLYDDIDDYNGFSAQPPTDPWGIGLAREDGRSAERHPGFQPAAGYFRHWRQRVDVHYVDEADLSAPLPAGVASDYRAVHVRIYVDDPLRGPREMAHLTRVFVHVPPP
jgi:type II secretory pathway pseudopilin PulG